MATKQKKKGGPPNKTESSIRKIKMKKKLFLTTAILLFAGFITACTTEFAYSLNVTVDKTEAKIGDTVTATVAFRHFASSGMNRREEIELPRWIVAEGGNRKDDILRVVFTPERDFEGDFFWLGWEPPYPGNETTVRRTVRIRRGEEIRRQFRFTITETKDLYVQAAVFYFWSTGYLQRNWNELTVMDGLIAAIWYPIKITVQQ